MRYRMIREAVFCRRPNRFIAEVKLDGIPEIVHVKNTGRCRELLIPGCRVYLSRGENRNRKTRFDLIAVEKKLPEKTLLINMDAQAPNEAAAEWLSAGGLVPSPDLIRREVAYRDSRFDFYLEKQDRKVFVEVKGVTLEQDGTALFPDAPTLRGVKHLTELSRAVYDGYETFVLFVIQMKGVSVFRPNDRTHPGFGDALRAAHRQGVGVLAMDCLVSPDGMILADPVKIDLKGAAYDGSSRGVIGI